MHLLLKWCIYLLLMSKFPCIQAAAFTRETQQYVLSLWPLSMHSLFQSWETHFCFLRLTKPDLFQRSPFSSKRTQITIHHFTYKQGTLCHLKMLSSFLSDPGKRCSTRSRLQWTEGKKGQILPLSHSPMSASVVYLFIQPTLCNLPHRWFYVMGLTSITLLVFSAVCPVF